MKVEVQEISPVERAVEVQVESQRVDSAFERQMVKFLREIKLPGFRKGKAPRKMAERYANPAALQQGVFEDLVPQAYREAVEQAQLAPISQPKVELVQMEQGKDLIFKARFEVFPELKIEASEYEGIEVPVPQLEVRDEDVQRVVDDLRKKHERTVALEESRPLAATDVAVVSFSGSVGGNLVPNASADSYQLDMEAGLFIEGFTANLVGMAVGEKKSFDVEFPAEYANKDLGGKTVTFEVELISIKVKELPALDDDFAKEASPFSTFEEMMAHIRERAERSLRQDIGTRALEVLVAGREVPAPSSYIQHRAYVMLENQARQLQQYGIRFEDFIKMRGLSVEQIIDELRPSAERMVRVELLSAAIIETEQISLGDDDFDAEAALWASDSGVSVEEFKAHLKESNQIEPFKAEALRSRVRDVLARKVKAVLKEETPAEEEAPEAAAAEEAGEPAGEAPAKKPRAPRKKAE